jgi:hypothetical protein
LQFGYTPAHLDGVPSNVDLERAPSVVVVNCPLNFTTTFPVIGEDATLIFCSGQQVPVRVITVDDGPSLLIITVQDFTVATKGSIAFTGSRIPVFLVFGNASIEGVIKVSANGTQGGPGARSLDSVACVGDPSLVSTGGGGGGGFLGAGGTAGANGASGGLAEQIDLDGKLVGGCSGGAGGGGAGGGGGVVAKQISASGALDVAADKNLATGGGGGGGHPNSGGGGGGSGGVIYLEAPSVTFFSGQRLSGGGGGGGGDAENLGTSGSDDGPGGAAGGSNTGRGGDGGAGSAGNPGIGGTGGAGDGGGGGAAGRLVVQPR